MKNSTSLVLASLAAVLLLAPGCSKENKPGSAAQSDTPAKTEAPKTDLTALQRSWHGEERGGQPGQTNSLVLSGNNLEFHGADPQEWYKGTFTLHEETNPKQMIVTITDCPAPQYIGKTANAIYRIENGVLTIAGCEPGNPTMPAGFDAPGTRLMTFNAQ